MFYIDSSQCTGCGTCVEVCPQEAISLKDEKAVIKQEMCTQCGSCLDSCPADAIYEVSPPEVAPRPSPAPAPLPKLDKRQAGLAAAIVNLAPAALELLSGLARRWLSVREERANMPGIGLGPGIGRRRRWRGGRR